MMKFQKLFAVLLLATFFFSCKKNESNTNAIDTPFNAGESITAFIAGKITAQDGSAISNVDITIGSSKTTTDVNGFFYVSKATVSSNAAFIKASKTGYFTGGKTIIAKEKIVNNITLQLIKKVESGSFVNANGGTITVTNGGSIDFPANAVALKTGGAYTGTVKVYAYHLDPSTTACYAQMPGSLRGITAANNDVALSTYGMMVVELFGSNGEALQLATNKQATLTMPIATGQQSDATTTIPLWYFNETNGMWVEEGSATKTGNSYVGKVSHFSWWNVDKNYPMITLELKVVDQNGNPVANATVALTRTASNGIFTETRYNATASDGTVIGIVPANETFGIVVKSNSSGYCQYPSTTTSIGPFAQNTNYGNYVVTISAANVVTVTGNAVDCNNKPLQNGYITFKTNGYSSYAFISNGAFIQSYYYCSTVPVNPVNVEVYDLNTLKKNTNPISVNVTGAGIYNLNNVSVCGNQVAMSYSGNVIDMNGNPIPKWTVVFSDTTSIPTYNVNGVSFSTILPLNKIITRKIFVANTCNGNYTMVDSTQIGPFTSDFNAGNINVSIPSGSNTITFSGTVTDCNNVNVTKGSAVISIDGQTLVANITNGSFSTSIIRCSGSTSTASVMVIDSVNKKRNLNALTYSVSNTNINIGNVQACGYSINEYLVYNFGGTTYSDTGLIAKLASGYTYFWGNSSKYYFNGNFLGSSTGSYSKVSAILNDNSGTYTNNINQTTVTANITEYGVVGQYIAGTFTGYIMDSTNTGNFPINGSFRIKRTQ